MRRTWSHGVRCGSLVGLVVTACFLQWPPASHAQRSSSIVALLDITAPGRGTNVFGSGFLINPDGTVLTNAHVLLGAQRDPDHHRLIALWQADWFSASVICTSIPGSDPAALDFSQAVHPRRDIAEVRLAPALDGRVLNVQGRQWRPHTGGLPAFPALRFALHDPAPGQEVEAVAYDFTAGPPTLTTKRGRVRDLYKASDGTPVIGVHYTTPIEHGASGAPILDLSGDVVGIQTWGSASTPGDGAAIAQSALRTPCR